MGMKGPGAILVSITFIKLYTLVFIQERILISYMVQIDVKLRFLTLLRFKVRFESVANGLGGQNLYFMYIFGLKSFSAG